MKLYTINPVAYGFLFPIGFFFLMFALFISILVFWVLMFVDVVLRKFKSGTEKAAWILVLIFGQFIGAVVYFFVVYLKKKRKR